MNDTQKTDEWETYCDECYYHMWRVRRKNERGFDDGFHLQNGNEANQLVELLNKQDDELTTVTEQRDRLAEACDQYSEDEILCKLQEITEQRDRLATILQGIRSEYRGQIPDPTCDCGDCAFLITIDNALQYLTKPN
jgi:uncharacterized coiled-coil DUF342 family protein